MKIGIAGPVSLGLLRHLLPGAALHEAYSFPFVAFLVRELHRRGHSVSVFALAPGLVEPFSFKGERIAVHLGRYRTTARERTLDFFRLEREDLLSAMQADRCDVLHAHWTYEFALAALDSGIPTLVTVHDWAPTILLMQRTPKDFAYRFVRLLMNRRALKTARHLTTVSPAILAKLRKHGYNQVALIPNGVPDEFFCHEPRTPHGAVGFLLSVNNGFGARKNVKALLRAFSLLRPNFPQLRLRLVGPDYELGGPAHRWATAANLQSSVEFIGPLAHEEVLKQMDQAILLVHPALEESFGCVLLEAMCRRLPVVGGERSGAVPWVLDNGAAGALCNVRRPEAIAKTVGALLTDRKRWLELSEAGYQRARGTFSLNSVVDLYMQQYEQISV